MVTTRTWLIDISLERCEELLATTKLGRVAVIVDGRPEIFPVNHVYDTASGTVAFPTRPGTKLEGALAWPWTAFEVDGIDATGGWSVALVGAAEEITDAEEIARLASARDVVWGAGDGAHWVRIVPTKVSGRTIQGETG